MDVTIYYTGWNGKKGSHDLLLAAAKDWLREQDRQDQTGDLVLKDPGTYKKPYFLSPGDIAFSISHSGKLWMCAFGNRELGLDVQGDQKCSPGRLSKRFFHPEENLWLQQNAYRDFLQIWAAKESYLKYTGEGLTRGMDFFTTADENGLKTETQGVMQKHFQITWKSEGKNETAAVCVTGKQIDQVCWRKLSLSGEDIFETTIQPEEK